MRDPPPVAQLPKGFYFNSLERHHQRWVQAIIAHTMSFDSPIWGDQPYPGGRTQRCYDMFHAIEASVRQTIESDLGLGVFRAEEDVGKDQPATNEEDGKPGSAGTNDRLKWDFNNPDATREELLAQMDFPLVSITLTNDAAFPEPQPGPSAADKPPVVKAWADIADGHGDISDALKATDKRDPSVYSPTK